MGRSEGVKIGNGARVRRVGERLEYAVQIVVCSVNEKRRLASGNPIHQTVPATCFPSKWTRSWPGRHWQRPSMRIPRRAETRLFDALFTLKVAAAASASAPFSCEPAVRLVEIVADA